MANFIVTCSLFIFILVQLSVEDIPTIQVTDFATNGNVYNDFGSGAAGFVAAAADKYIFVHDDVSGVIVYERDAQGNYSIVHNNTWPRIPAFVTTNGKWFGTLGSGFINSFQLGANGTFDNMTQFNSLALFMQFLSDNTLVLINETVVETFEFSTSQWTKIRSQPVNFTVVTIFTKTGEPADSAPHVTDTTLAAYNPRGAVELYTRNADKSWTLVDEVAIDTTQYRANRILWDGADSLVLGHATFLNVTTGIQGRVLIYSKASGSWTLTDVIAGSSLPNPTNSFFAFSLRFVDLNTIAIGAPTNPGQVFIMQREVDGPWQITARIIGRIDWYNFGHDIMTTNIDLVIYTGDTNELIHQQQAVVSGCKLPALAISYSCHDVTVDSCESVVDISYGQLYQVNEVGQCTTVSLRNYRIQGDQSTTLSFEFTHDSVTVYCNSTITCLSSPIVTTPSSQPVSSNGPTTSNNPPKSNVPGTPDSNSQTSGAMESSRRLTLFIVIYSIIVALTC